MIYIKIKTSKAERMSEGLYRLMQPPGFRLAGQATRFYCERHDHADGEWSVLAMPENEVVPIHYAADGGLLTEVLSESVADGTIMLQELQAIGGALQQMAGQTVSIVNLIPPSWANQPGAVMNEEQARAAGFLPALEEITP